MLKISIHALLAESDTVVDNIIFMPWEFLSTLSLRRATGKSNKLAGPKLVFLSTLSLRRATWLRCWQLAARDISIHALLAESDEWRIVGQFVQLRFLSTLSLRRATRPDQHRDAPPKFLSTLSLRRATSRASRLSPVISISIHALLAESDGSGPAWLASRPNFYPRSPCGERQ